MVSTEEIQLDFEMLQSKYPRNSKIATSSLELAKTLSLRKKQNLTSLEALGELTFTPE